MLNQNSYEPLYIQIADSIARRIQAGDLAAGDRLPSERQLSEELSVSRMTIRQAFDMLADRGLIERQRGIGSVVSSPKLEQPVDVLIGFSDNMERKGIKPGARLLALQHQMADPTVAQTLQLKVGQPVYFIHRLRLANDIPMALEFSFFPAHLCPQLD
jgi:GntR family transcriptional regulator